MIASRAILMAAGTSSRFVPNTLEKPKGLTRVKEEILIERQINQLKEAGVAEIIVVTGYMAESFDYLKQFDVTLIHNPEYNSRNNHSSLFYAKEYLEDCLICSSDNYFNENPFTVNSDMSYYSAVYVDGGTDEWIIEVDCQDMITGVTVGGEQGWIMLGHAYFNSDFGRKFRNILESEYSRTDIKDKFWENIFLEHLDRLDMKLLRYPDNLIFEFDSLDELRAFDDKFMINPDSTIHQSVARQLGCSPAELYQFAPIRSQNQAIGFTFRKGNDTFEYLVEGKVLRRKETL